MNKIIEKIGSELKRLNVEFLVCGGSALELNGFPVRTMDVDILATTNDFKKLERTLKKSRKFRIIDRIENMIGTEFRFEGKRIDVEFVNAELFSGKMPAERFFNYLKRYKSKAEKRIFFVKPEIVWFMRLVIGDWQVYIQKILRDIRAGVPIETIPKTKKLARKTGTEKLLRERIKKLEEIIKTIE